MAKLLFRLNQVPDDEADEIRQLLDEGKFDYYETSPGLLGLSFAAIWLKDEQQYDQANQLIEDYQLKRSAKAREHFASLKQADQHITLWRAFKQSPIRLAAAVIFVCIILYLTLTPFFPNLFA
ncbi:DUF6164 family protein [Aliikangiella maris]|uniref:DUF6164 family protein n=2 Tax=Aliikangiella maris TaxID=3162458 RepID=A0ABV3MQL3_9GAMM